MRRALIIAVVFLLASCQSIGVPAVTPTVAPTRTATPTPQRTIAAQLATRTPFPTATDTEAPTLAVEVSETWTPSPSPSMTATASPTASATQTLTPSRTPTATDTNAPTATSTWTPSPTATFTTTLTPSATVTPTVTNLPRIVPTNTNTPTPTATLTLTPTSTLTPEPTATNTVPPPTSTPVPPTETFTPAATSTRLPTRTLAPTWTPLPLPSATRTLAATIDATPTFVTAAPETPVPEDLALTITPALGESTEEVFVPTMTPSPAPTVANVLPPPTISINDLPQISVQGINTRAFAIGSGAVSGVQFNLGVNNPILFAQNPVNPDQYLATDNIGLLYTVAGGQPSGLGMSPFTGLETSREDNNAIVVDAAWSPDGRSIAFVVNADKTENDGVWWYEPGATAPLQLLVDCLPNRDCVTVVRDTPPYAYETRSVVWSPQSDAVLAQVYMYEYDRYAQIILPRTGDPNIRSQRPPAYQYDYGDWSVDGQRIIVSGRTEDGRVVLGSINRYAGNDRNQYDEQIVLDGSARGLWIQNGVQRPDGTLIALGRAGGSDGPMQILDQNGDFLTGSIGGARPVKVRWSPDRSQVYVENADGRRYIASINGTIDDITDRVGSVQAVAWVGGNLPPAADDSVPDVNNVPPDYIPSGVIEGARFQPGQQVRVNSPTGRLNLRSTPELIDGNIVGSVLNGEYVAILAGPRSLDGVEWWQVQIVSGQRAWIAAVIDGAAVLAP